MELFLKVLKYLPFEIVLDDIDPDNGNPEHKPAGNNPRGQRRKWKIWINTNTQKLFYRKSKYINDWVEFPILKVTQSFFLNTANQLPDGVNDLNEDVYRNGHLGLNTIPTSKLHLNGTFANTPLVITANKIIGLTENITTVYIDNNATNITITLPDPTLCVGRIYAFSRFNNASTGTITINCAIGGNRLQNLNGSITTTTTIASNGANGQGLGIKFQSVNGVWRRI